MTLGAGSRADRRCRECSCPRGCSALAACGLTACSRSAPDRSQQGRQFAGDQNMARRVALIVSGDTAGWIMPCGCTANQSGGLSRRGTFVRRARADHAVVLADAGGAPGGTSPYERLKFEAILAGERAMGIAAHNLGAPEAALGAGVSPRDPEKARCPVPFGQPARLSGAL